MFSGLVMSRPEQLHPCCIRSDERIFSVTRAIEFSIRKVSALDTPCRIANLLSRLANEVAEFVTSARVILEINHPLTNLTKHRKRQDSIDSSGQTDRLATGSNKENEHEQDREGFEEEISGSCRGGYTGSSAGTGRHRGGCRHAGAGPREGQGEAPGEGHRQADEHQARRQRTPQGGSVQAQEQEQGRRDKAGRKDRCEERSRQGIGQEITDLVVRFG